MLSSVLFCFVLFSVVLKCKVMIRTVKKCKVLFPSQVCLGRFDSDDGTNCSPDWLCHVMWGVVLKREVK